MDVLTEAITKEEVDRAVAFGVDISGINNRQLHDLSIDLTRSGQLAECSLVNIMLILADADGHRQRHRFP